MKSVLDSVRPSEFVLARACTNCADVRSAALREFAKRSAANWRSSLGALGLLLSSVLLCGGACFNFDPRADAGDFDPGGTIEGTIITHDFVGSAVGPVDEATRHATEMARVDVTLARRRSAVDDTARAPLRPTTDDRAGKGVTVDDLPRGPVKMDWRPGDLMVFTRRDVATGRGAYDKRSLPAVLKKLQRAAGRTDVVLDVVRCSGGLFCYVTAKDNSGAPLDRDETADIAAALLKQVQDHVVDGLVTVTRNFRYQGYRVPNDPQFFLQWHYQLIGLPAAWDVQIGSDDVVVAVVDSGIVSANPDLNNRVLKEANGTVVGVDLISDPGSDGDNFPGRDTSPEDPGDHLFGNRSSYHGTHIAGTIAAETDNNEGVAGVTWRSKIMPVRVLGLQLSGDQLDILEGIVWAMGEPIDGLPTAVRKARIVNLSFGGAVDQAAFDAWDFSINSFLSDPAFGNPIFIAAAGNADIDAGQITPANLPQMIVVGATRLDGGRANYSNFGPSVDIMGPGGQAGTDLNSDGQDDLILSTWDNGFDVLEGTSMACPHVAGVAALLLSSNPALNQATVESILKSSATTSSQCNEGCGAGLLNAAGAIVLSGAELVPQPLLGVDNQQVFFPAGLGQLAVTVRSLGSDGFSFDAAITGAQAQLFSVDRASATLTGALGDTPSIDLAVSLDRQAFTAGSANLVITGTGAAAGQEVTVNLQFSDDPARVPRLLQTVEVGAYTKAEDGTLNLVATGLAERSNAFAYKITGLGTGDYFVYAVGDDDDNGVFDSQRESFGAYPRTAEPAKVHVEDDVPTTGIDFSVATAFLVGVVGGVGAPCDEDGDCTFTEDAQCIVTFNGGYCSRDCANDGICGAGASCEVLECTNGGVTEPCSVCLSQCASDSQCRFGEGYSCDPCGTCTPDGFCSG